MTQTVINTVFTPFPPFEEGERLLYIYRHTRVCDSNTPLCLYFFQDNGNWFFLTNYYISRLKSK